MSQQSAAQDVTLVEGCRRGTPSNVTGLGLARLGIIGRIALGLSGRMLAEPLGAVARGLRSLVSGLANPQGAGEADPTRSIAFTIGFISLAAKMARADGVVTPEEIYAFRRLYSIRPEDEAAVLRVFRIAHQHVAGYQSYARQVHKLLDGQEELLLRVLDGLFHIALADGYINSAEKAYLASVAEIFGFSEEAFSGILKSHVEGKPDPWATLGVAPGSDRETIRHAYLEKARSIHPDILIAAGMPADAIALASERMTALNGARDALLATS